MVLPHIPPCCIPGVGMQHRTASKIGGIKMFKTLITMRTNLLKTIATSDNTELIAYALMQYAWVKHLLRFVYNWR